MKIEDDVFDENVPMQEETKKTALEFNISPMACAYNGGEDYELLFTINKEDYEKVKYLADVHMIGVVKPKEEGVFLISESGNKHEIKALGFQHFKE